ncbi:hypothetical protein UlMin_023578 [Ulmus minor]
MAIASRGKVDAILGDLAQAVFFSSNNVKAFCYKVKKMVEEAKKAYKEALKVEPELVVVREVLHRLTFLKMRLSLWVLRLKPHKDCETRIDVQVIDGMMIKDGYLYKKVSIDSLSCWGVMLTEEELLKFTSFENNDS